MQNQDKFKLYAVHQDDDVIPDEGDSESDQIEIPDFDIPINGTGDNDNQERCQQGGQLNLLQGHSLQMLGEDTSYFSRSFVVSRYFQEHKERMRNAENEVPINFILSKISTDFSTEFLFFKKCVIRDNISPLF